MPNRWPIASGNWSNAAIWSGSLIPTASDDVFANNRIITVDQNISVRSLQNSPTGSVLGDGTFISTNGISITSSRGIFSASGTLFIVTGSDSVSFSSSFFTTGSISRTGSLVINSTGTITIIGDITASGAPNSSTIVMNVPGTLIITGSLLNNGPATGATNAHGVFLITGSLCSISGSLNGTAGTSTFTNHNLRISGSCPVIITGSISGGRSQSVYNQLNPQTVNILGNCTVVWTGGSSTITIQHSAVGSMNIIGNLYANGAGAVITNSGVGILNVFGNLTSDQGGGNQPAVITNTSTGTVIVTGSVSTGTSTAAITSTTAGTIIVRGPISSSTTAVGVSSTSTTATNLFTGPFYNTGSYNAVYAYRMQMLSTSSSWRFDTETAGVTKTLYTSNQLPGVPRQTDVRKGTQYNFGLTGSLEMPDPTVVKTGVAVDNTTGSAILTAQDMFDIATQTLTTSGSIVNLLTGASTVQTTGATISSFKV